MAVQSGEKVRCQRFDRQKQKNIRNKRDRRVREKDIITYDKAYVIVDKIVCQSAPQDAPPLVPKVRILLHDTLYTLHDIISTISS